MVYSRLARRLRALGLTRFKDYRALLDDPENDEIIACINAITTNLTRFFRESHHFDHLRDEVLPKAAQGSLAGNGKRRFRLWSAGCSTGEEAYSMAMTVAEFVKTPAAWDMRILATDLDTQVLATASAGLYPKKALDTVSAAQRKRWFARPPDSPRFKVEDDAKERFKIDSRVRNLIAFKQLNLLEGWPMKGPFDAIFCRNVMIYFDRETQKTLVDRFADLLKPDGFLYLGHSESLFRVTDRFHHLGQTIHQRTR